MAVGAQGAAPLDAAAQVLHLGLVGGDDAEVDLLVEDAMAADAVDVGDELVE